MPGESTDFEALTDVKTVVVKIPGVNNDKYLIDEKINIVIPMAGMGSRFSIAGYDKPKPFIDVVGKPMIVRVLENLKIPNAFYYLIARKEHLEKEPEIVQLIEDNYPVKFIALDKLTEGSACTVLFARKYIDNDIPVLIANSDQIVDIDISNFVDDCENRALDGSILSFVDGERNPKWSFARTDENKLVVEVKRKRTHIRFSYCRNILILVRQILC